MGHFGLADAITVYNTYLDHNHRLFAYLQVVAGGGAAFVWADRRDQEVVYAILVGFLVIAVSNARLFWLSQKSLITIAAAIHKLCDQDEEMDPALRPVVATYEAYGLWSMMLLYIAITVMGALAIGAALVWR